MLPNLIISPVAAMQMCFTKIDIKQNPDRQLGPACCRDINNSILQQLILGIRVVRLVWGVRVGCNDCVMIVIVIILNY